MKRLYARLRRWFARRSRPEGANGGGSIQFFATEISGVDPTTGRVMWRITKGGFVVAPADTAQSSGVEQ